jgi:signal transduction histidine kinase/ligand-binding sensor domain-containing protein
MGKKVLLFILLGFLCLPVLGQAQSIVSYESYFDNYLIRTFDREDGMPGQAVFYTHEDSSGFIWIANISGLVRFDGLTLRTFDKGNKGGSFYEIFEDENGHLLIPSIGQGVYKFTGDTLLQYKDEIPTPNGFVKTMYPSKSGDYYLGLYGASLAVFDGEKTIKTYTPEDGLLSTEIWKIIEDKDGRVWIGTNDGLSILEEGTFTNYTVDNGLPYNTIRGLTEMSNGDVWVGTDREGIVIFRDLKPIKYIHTKDGLSGSFPQYFAENPIDGSIWIAHHGNGLDRYQDGNIDNISQDEGLHTDYLTFVGFSKDGTAFVGHETGMSVLTKRKVDVINEDTPGIDQQGIVTVIEDSKGTTWLGSDGGGFYYSTDSGWKTLEFPAKITNGYASVATVDRTGNLWMTTQGTGVVKIVNYEIVLHINSDDGLIDDFARGIAVDNNNNLWIGTNLGISVIDQQGKVIDEYTTSNGLANNFTITMISDSSGRIWHGSYGGGITVFDEDSILTFNTSNGLQNDQVFSFFEYSDNKIFIGTIGSGIHYFDGDELHYFGLDQGFPFGTVSGMAKDDNGYLWCASGNGIYRIHPSQIEEIIAGKRQTIEFLLLNTEDGLPINEMEPANGQTIDRLSTGEIIFASSKGVSVLNPSSIHVNNEVFFPYIDQLIVDENSLDLNSPRDLTPEDKKIEISYSALNIRTPKKTKFRVRLDGIDDEWVYVENRTTAYYDYLPDGEYSFHVSAIGPDGQWSDKTATIDFTVLPPFYKTWWFIGLCFIGFASLSAGGVYWRSNQKLKALNRELEMQQKIQLERERISRELHDNVGSQISNLITGIEISNLHVKNNQQDQALSLLDNLDNDARGAMTDLRETIWLLDKEKVEFGIFLDHLNGYLKRQQRYLKELKVEVSSSVNPQLILSPDRSLNLTRIVQEALNNTNKYAKASVFSITCSETNGKVRIVLNDDGIGMDAEAQIGSGNGLVNMHERAKMMGASILIESKHGTGTTITLEFT